MKKLSDAEVIEQLGQLPGWQLKGSEIYKEYSFKDFNAALKFVVSLASQANKLDHHPDWSNSYNKVFIKLTTHDIDGISELDIALARTANSLATKINDQKK